MYLKTSNFYPLTYSQKRILNIELENPESSMCNIGGHVRFEGPINLEYLEEAIHMFIEDNEAARLQIVEINGDFHQKVVPYSKSPITLIDFSNQPNYRENLSLWIQQEAEKPFVFTNNRLFYFALFKLSDNEFGYLAKFHHIIADGWSMQLMTSQIIDNYQYLIGETRNRNTHRITSFLDYLEQEQLYLNSPRFEKDRVYWNEKINLFPLDSFDTLKNRHTNNLEGKRQIYKVDKNLSIKIKDFIDKTSYSVQTFFTSVFSILISKMSQNSNVFLRIPITNRSSDNQKRAFGMYASTMPFWTNLSSNLTFYEILKSLNSDLRRNYIHQKYPYNLIIRDLLTSTKISDQIFDLSINCYNTYLKNEMDGIKVYNEEFYNGQQNFSMQLIIREWSNTGNIELDFDYKVGDFSDDQVDNLYKKLLVLINQVINFPTKKIDELRLLSIEEEKEICVDFNNTIASFPKEKTIHQLFENQVLLTPQKIAINFNDESLTYEDLNKKANQLANLLIVKGVGNGSVVGILAKHSLNSVIGILAILKSGGTYLPIDPAFPTSRIIYMLKDSNTYIVLSDRTKLELQIENSDIEFINLNDETNYSERSTTQVSQSLPSDLAYIIYTSGSTGRPKGTLIEHQSLVNYTWWAKKMYVNDNDEIFALFTSLSFDLTVTSIFTPLVTGGSIIVYQNDKNGNVLHQIVKDNRVTVLKLTPSHLSLLHRLDDLSTNTSIKRLIVGGEELKSNYVRLLHLKWKRPIEVYNEYGPTEATVGCMLAKYDQGNSYSKRVPIGRPADNVQIYVLDSNKMPVPKLVVGEIYISGVCLARGYLNNPNLNKEKFVSNPFIPKNRMYKTGDRARFLPNGELEYIGRYDDFIKHKGYRIELGEIDNVLVSCAGVVEAVTIQKSDNSGNEYLCSFVVCSHFRSERELMNDLSKLIPNYMIPERIEFLDKMPLNTNNKIDKHRLNSIDSRLIQQSNSAFQEKIPILINVVSKVLQIENVSRESNFYHLGGDSIKAIQIASALNEEGYQILVKDIMSNPRIEDIANHLYPIDNIEITMDSTRGEIPITPMVSWFFEQKLNSPESYHQSILLDIRDNVTEQELEMIWLEVINRHDSLRMILNSNGERLIYNEKSDLKSYFFKYDLRHLEKNEQETNIQKIYKEIKASTDLKNGPLTIACLFNLGSRSRKFLIIAHHLVIDGLSWRIILQDMYNLLLQLKENRNLTLPTKSSSFKDWAKKINQYDASEEEIYWKQVVNVQNNLKLPYDSIDNGIDNMDTAQIFLEQKETLDLLYSANRIYNTETKDLLICALFLTLFEFCNSNTAVIELEGHGREELFKGINLNRTVGWFTTLYPFAWEATNNELSLQIKSIKEKLRGVPQHGIGFGILKYIQKKIKNTNNPFVRFNYLGEFVTEEFEDFWKVLNISGITGSLDGNENNSTTEIDIQCIVIKDQLSVSVYYNTSSFSKKTMQSFIQLFVKHIRNIIKHCCERDTVDFTLSDFDGAQLTEEDLNILFE